MTVHIPKWVLFAFGACAIAVVAFFIGKGSNDDGSGERDVANAPKAKGGDLVNQSESPTLGAKAFSAPYGYGFGTVQPRSIYNGGDTSGLVEEISWQDWGESTAYGTGLGHQFRPNGGYYDKPVKVRLQARDLGTCGKGTSPAYTVLFAQMQERPGGPYGDWIGWSGSGAICDPPY